MRSGPAISIALALALGAAAAFLARGALHGTARQTAPEKTVLVADRAIGFGTALTADNLREVHWPAGAPVEGSFPSVSALVHDGRRLSLSNLQPNEPILKSRVTAPNQRATLSTQIDEGMRAVSVRVDEVRGVAGFVLPGDRVDVVLTRGDSGSQDAGAYADILMQNVKVLAVDQLANERQDKPAIARAVTLELSVEQAQKVILAQGIGHLSLILRQAGERDVASAPRVTADDLGIASGPSKNQLADLEKRFADLKASTEQSTSREVAAALKRVSEMEARMRAEAASSSTSSIPVLKTPARPVVNVIRNGNKSEKYTVQSER